MASRKEETKKKKKYTLYYCSGPTGYGWREDYDRLNECEAFINEMRREVTCEVSLWDNTINDYIYWRRCMCYTPEVDLLHCVVRDMRTKTKRMK